MRPPTIGYAVFLKNREARVTIVKKTKKADEESQPIVEDVLSPEKIALVEETGKRWLTYIAATVVVTVAAIKVVDVIGDIAVKKTKSADNQE